MKTFCVRAAKEWLGTVHRRSVVCLTTGPWRLPKRVLHTVRSSASAFYLEYPLASVRSPSSCLRLLPRLVFLHYRNIHQFYVSF